MDEALVDIAQMIYDRYDYMGVGTSATTPSSTSLHNVVSPIFARSVVNKAIETTYVTNDTVSFSASFLATESADLYEAGIFKDLETSTTSDVMLCRQTYTKYSIENGGYIGITWKVICARG